MQRSTLGKTGMIWVGLPFMISIFNMLALLINGLVEKLKSKKDRNMIKKCFYLMQQTGS